MSSYPPAQQETPWNIRTIAAASLLFLVFLVLRMIYTTSPELGGDAARKFEIARLIAESGNWQELLSDRHHSARWGINVPLIGAIKIFGYGVTSYMIVPLLMFTASIVMLMGFARDTFSRWGLVVLGVLMFYEPMFFRASTNPQPFVFGVFYITVALWTLVRFIDSGKFRYLLVSALFAFLCYGAKESYVYFFPALFLLLLVRKGIRPCIYYGAILLFLLGLETIVFNALSSGEYNLGRLEYLRKGRHLQSMYKKASFGGYSVWEFLTRRWFETPMFTRIATSIFTIYFAAGILSGRLFRLNNYVLGVFLLTASYFAVLTFVPLSIKPLLSVQPLSGKYLTTVMPFTMFCVAFILDWIPRFLGPKLEEITRKSVAGIATIFLAYALILESPIQYEFHATYPVKDAFIWTQDRHIAQLNQSLEDGKGICIKRRVMKKTASYWLRYYMAQGLPNETLDSSKHKRTRILHLEKYKFDELSGYVPADQLMKILAMPMCQQDDL